MTSKNIAEIKRKNEYTITSSIDEKMKYPIVLVKWLDSCVKIGWTKDHNDANLIPIDSVGFLIYEDNRIIKLALSNCVDLDFGEIITIPQSVVVKRTTLSAKKVKK